jgi:hypothetical protein
MSHRVARHLRRAMERWIAICQLSLIILVVVTLGWVILVAGALHMVRTKGIAYMSLLVESKLGIQILRLSIPVRRWIAALI